MESVPTLTVERGAPWPKRVDLSALQTYGPSPVHSVRAVGRINISVIVLNLVGSGSRLVHHSWRARWQIVKELASGKIAVKRQMGQELSIIH